MKKQLMLTTCIVLLASPAPAQFFGGSTGGFLTGAVIGGLLASGGGSSQTPDEKYPITPKEKNKVDKVIDFCKELSSYKSQISVLYKDDWSQKRTGDFLIEAYDSDIKKGLARNMVDYYYENKGKVRKWQMDNNCLTTYAKHIVGEPVEIHVDYPDPEPSPYINEHGCYWNCYNPKGYGYHNYGKGNNG